MATDTASSSVEEAARALLENRIDAVRVLAHARQNRIDKRAELDIAEREEAAAFAAAQRAGWSVDELKRVGLDQPARKAPGRPRRSRTSRATAASAGADRPTDRASAASASPAPNRPAGQTPA
jgi:hypothetical protein